MVGELLNIVAEPIYIYNAFLLDFNENKSLLIMFIYTRRVISGKQNEGLCDYL